MRKFVINFGILAAFVIGITSVHAYLLGFDPRLVTQTAGAVLLTLGLLGAALGTLLAVTFVKEMRPRLLLFSAVVVAITGGWVLVLSLPEKELVVISLAVAPFLSALALTWFMDRICPAADGPARYEDRVFVVGAVLFGFLGALARVPYTEFVGVAPLFAFGFFGAFVLTRKPREEQSPPQPASMRPERTRTGSAVWID